jgi:hypothetical protein
VGRSLGMHARAHTRVDLLFGTACTAREHGDNRTTIAYFTTIQGIQHPLQISLPRSTNQTGRNHHILILLAVAVSYPSDHFSPAPHRRCAHRYKNLTIDYRRETKKSIYVIDGRSIILANQTKSSDKQKKLLFRGAPHPDFFRND